jgi:hypothetical protein
VLRLVAAGLSNAEIAGRLYPGEVSYQRDAANRIIGRTTKAGDSVDEGPVRLHRQRRQVARYESTPTLKRKRRS